MPYRDSATAKAARLHRKAALETVPKVPCACGCGILICPVHVCGTRLVRFALGHKPPRQGLPKRIAEAQQIQCACGCGKLLLERNRHGNKRRYIQGHANFSKFQEADPPFPGMAQSYQAKRNWARRVAVLQYYGGNTPKCVCCGETRLAFLAVDHKNGKGNEHRRAIGKSGLGFLVWLVKNNFPEGFQVLCHNCNMSRGLYGGCPHCHS